MVFMPERRLDIEYVVTATQELADIAQYHIDLVGIDSARKITDRIMDALSLVRVQPGIGIMCRDRKLREQGYRMLICGHHLCFYRVIDRTVFVYHIVDSRTDYRKLLHDLMTPLPKRD